MNDKVRPSLAFLWLAYSYMKDEELKRGVCMDPHMSGYIDILSDMILADLHRWTIDAYRDIHDIQA
jgi:hypothetical protein